MNRMGLDTEVQQSITAARSDRWGEILGTKLSECRK